MFGKILRGVFGFAKYTLAAFGLVVILAAWWIFGGDKPPEAAAQPAAVVVEPVPAASCECSAGALCTGPRGGQYCTDAAGRKRYR